MKKYLWLIIPVLLMGFYYYKNTEKPVTQEPEPIIVKDFEGEADPNRMTLDMTEWRWIKSEYNDERVILPKQEGRFTLSFSKDGRLSIKTDCNSMSTTYSVKEGQISFGPTVSTKMYCEGSQESDFAKDLTNSSSYRFTSRGELILNIKYDSGVMVFR